MHIGLRVYAMTELDDIYGKPEMVDQCERCGQDEYTVKLDWYEEQDPRGRFQSILTLCATCARDRREPS